MTNKTISIINKANRVKEKYDILTFDTHERYQTQLCKTGHNFYSFRYDDCKEWDDTYALKPSNYYVLPKNSILNGIDFDFVLSQSKFGQFQVSQQINQTLRLPTISLEHTLPIPSWPNEQTQAFKQMLGDINVFISEYSIKEWGVQGDHDVVHHSVDAAVFQPMGIPKNPVVLSVVNDFINRDYCCNYKGWQRITEPFETRLVGNTEGLSKPAASIQELAEEYNSAQIFLNTSTISPVPTCLLEAMSCGCAVVTTATCMIPEIIKNGVNGFMSNDEQELSDYIQQLLDDEDLRDKLGNAARETILSDFSERKFIDTWNKIFDRAYGVII